MARFHGGFRRAVPWFLAAVIGFWSVEGQDMVQDVYVRFDSPERASCAPVGGDVLVRWRVVVAGDEASARRFLAEHQGSETCLAVGSDGSPHCVPFTSSEAISVSHLPSGCHTFLGWWRSANHSLVSTATSTSFAMGPGCPHTCSQPPGAADLAQIFPPNSRTGGYVQPGSLGAPCMDGCCEGDLPTALCPANASMPPCSECMLRTSPPRLDLPPLPLPEGASAGLWQGALNLALRHMAVVRETVLHSAFEDVEAADFDSLQALTMVERPRIDHLHALVQDVVARDVPGDFLEAGCWRGGVSLFAAVALATYDGLLPPERRRHRKAWLADSFEGIPAVDVETFPADGIHSGADGILILKENSIERVLRAARALGVEDSTIEILPGFFANSLPRAIQSGRFENHSFCILRLDGDLYQSTLESLHYLYPFLATGGHVVVDDFTDWRGTRQAVLDFRATHSIRTPLQLVWHEHGKQVRGVWWTKSKHETVDGAGHSGAYDPLSSSFTYGRTTFPPSSSHRESL